jgi:hypothetical protein
MFGWASVRKCPPDEYELATIEPGTVGSLRPADEFSTVALSH